jgi:hypothetical protein
MASGQVSVASAVGQSLVFTVTGTQTLAYATAFANAVAGTTNFVSLDTTPGAQAQLQGVDVEYRIQNTGTDATVPDGGGYVLDNAFGATTVIGSGAGDTVMFLGYNGGTYLDEGGSNQVIFIDGNNTYTGSDSSTGTDTIVAGSGLDTIITGTNSSIVDSGIGDATIVLNDTATGGNGFNDYVYLDDGMSTVSADGTSDAVIVNAPGQTIFGGTVTGALNAFILNDADTTLGGSAMGNNVVAAGAAATAVFDDTSNNTIYGGSGTLFVMEGTGVNSAYIVGGTGDNYVFGADGSNLVFYAGDGSTGANDLVAFGGTENIYAGISTANLTFFGGVASDSVTAATYNESLTGGSGNDAFVTGSGFETLTGGTGDNVFGILADSTGAGAHITITDFGASAGNLYEFIGFTGDPVVSETESSAGVTLTLTDNTTVTFLGETASGLNGHLI